LGCGARKNSAARTSWKFSARLGNSQEEKRREEKRREEKRREEKGE
jgi:hypothetical protein